MSSAIVGGGVGAGDVLPCRDWLGAGGIIGGREVGAAEFAASMVGCTFATVDLGLSGPLYTVLEADGERVKVERLGGPMDSVYILHASSLRSMERGRELRLPFLSCGRCPGRGGQPGVPSGPSRGATMADSLLLPLGEVIAWKCAGTTQAGLVAALKAAELDAGIARELAPRNAFSRALKKLDDSRVIRRTAEDARSISFQFTRESKVGGEFQYAIETVLTLDKHTGRIDCTHDQLAAAAREELDKAFENRTAADVTGIVQKIIERNGDLFPIRPQGGCYFVPQRHAGLVDQVQKFLGGIDGTVVRFAVSQGNPETERSIRDSVAAGLAGLIAEHEAAVTEFGADTRPDTIKRAAEKIRTARFKVEAYAALLGDQKAQLEVSLATAAEKLRAKVEEIGKPTPKPAGGGGLTAAEVPAGVAARSQGPDLFEAVEV